MNDRAAGFWVSALLHGGLVLVWLLTPTINPGYPVVARPVPLSMSMLAAPVLAESDPAPEIVELTPAIDAAPELAAETVEPMASAPTESSAMRPTEVKFAPVSAAEIATAEAARMPKERGAPTATPSFDLPADFRAAESEAEAAVAGKPSAAAALEGAVYLARVRELIEAHKFYPRQARRRGQEGGAVIRFVLGRDGAVEQLRVVESSGSPLLDQAALSAVTDVGHFPPFPDLLERGEWDLRVPRDFSLR